MYIRTQEHMMKGFSSSSGNLFYFPTSFYLFMSLTSQYKALMFITVEESICFKYYLRIYGVTMPSESVDLYCTYSHWQ